MMRRRELPESRPGRKERGAARDPRDARMLRTAGKMMALASASASVPVPPARHGHCLGSPAVRDVTTLPSRPSALPAGRAHARRILSEWGARASALRGHGSRPVGASHQRDPRIRRLAPGCSARACRPAHEPRWPVSWPGLVKVVWAEWSRLSERSPIRSLSAGSAHLFTKGSNRLEETDNAP